MKKFLFFFLLFFLSCAPAEKRIFLYSSSPHFIDSISKGLTLGIKETNEAGGISGHEISLIEDKEIFAKSIKNIDITILGPLSKKDKEFFALRCEKEKITTIFLFPDGEGNKNGIAFFNTISNEAYFLGESAAFSFNCNKVLILDYDAKIADAFLSGYSNKEREFLRISLNDSKETEDKLKEILKENEFQCVFLATSNEVPIEIVSLLKKEIPVVIAPFSTTEVSSLYNLDRIITTLPYYTTDKEKGDEGNFRTRYESSFDKLPSEFDFLGYESLNFAKSLMSQKLKRVLTGNKLDLTFSPNDSLNSENVIEKRFSLGITFNGKIFNSARDKRDLFKEIQEEVIKKRLKNGENSNIK
jgi:hypothetical protein